MEKSILLFDGVCNLCSGLVQFVLSNEKDSNINFAALQSKIGKQLLKDFKMKKKGLETSFQQLTHSRGKEQKTLYVEAKLIDSDFKQGNSPPPGVYEGPRPFQAHPLGSHWCEGHACTFTDR